jgi:hypothetical protein
MFVERLTWMKFSSDFASHMKGKPMGKGYAEMGSRSLPRWKTRQLALTKVRAAGKCTTGQES